MTIRIPFQYLFKMRSLNNSNPINLEIAKIITSLMVNTEEISDPSIPNAFNRKYFE